MKKLLLVLVLAFVGFTSQAQVEIKSNPVALLFEIFNLSAEYCINKNFGAEIDYLGVNGGSAVWISGKYYLSPKYGTDKFYVDAFLQALSDDFDTNYGGGFGLGYKIVAQSGLLFEAGAGIGRGKSSNDPLGYFKLSAGYRF